MHQTVVITGCSSGFGCGLARHLARRGDRVYATMRATEGHNARAARTLRKLDEAEALDLRVLDLDVTSTASAEAVARVVEAESGAADVVVNNAGRIYLGFTEAFTAAEVAAQLDVNVVGVHRVHRAFLPAMRARGAGLVVVVGSAAGRVAVPFNGVYHASKWALEGYALALRGELASSGVDVVIVEPGPFETALFPSAAAPADADRRAATYPAVARGAFAGMGEAFAALFADPEMPSDPALVVEAIADLAAREPGTRPFRTVVGFDFGVAARNADDAPHDDALLDAFGLTAFATLAVPSVEAVR